MPSAIVIRFLERADSLVLPRASVARSLLRRHFDTAHVCFIREGVRAAVEVLEAPRRLPSDVAEVWILPKGGAARAGGPFGAPA